MIRPAETGDAEAIATLLAETWRDMPYGEIPIDDERLRGTVADYLAAGDDVLALVSDVDGVQGVLLAAIQPLDIADGTVAADQAFICHSGEGASLARAYARWATGKGAALVTLSVSSGMSRAERLIQHMGFVPMGGLYRLQETS